jgi:hypothetical protein
MINDALTKNDRREFLKKTFSSCAFCCFASPIVFANGRINPVDNIQKHKFELNSGMSMQEVYNFAYKGSYIPAMKNLMKQIGKEKFLDMLKTSSEMLHVTGKDAAINYNERTLTAFSNNMKKGCENYKDRLTYEVLTDNMNVLEIKFTECLWAKTFREADAADIGYAGICYQDYPSAKAYNPKLTLIREKTLMQGNDCCHFKWVMET